MLNLNAELVPGIALCHVNNHSATVVSLSFQTGKLVQRLLWTRADLPGTGSASGVFKQTDLCRGNNSSRRRISNP